jgi:hypothetical protein
MDLRIKRKKKTFAIGVGIDPAQKNDVLLTPALVYSTPSKKDKELVVSGGSIALCWLRLYFGCSWYKEK